jgi:polyhydroxyalkanoate synthesis repressor PhaR
MANQAKDGDTVIIKKYANRRLYNTRTSSYITLDHLAQMVKENVEFKVIDAKSGADLTHSILTQIIMEEEAAGEQMLPTNFLRQLIAMYGNSMQALLPGYLEASMEHFRENQNKLRKAIEDRSAPIRWPRLPSATWKCSRPPPPHSCPAPPPPEPRRAKTTSRPAATASFRNCASRWPKCRRSWNSWASAVSFAGARALGRCPDPRTG